MKSIRAGRAGAMSAVLCLVACGASTEHPSTGAGGDSGGEGGTSGTGGDSGQGGRGGTSGAGGGGQAGSGGQTGGDGEVSPRMDAGESPADGARSGDERADSGSPADDGGVAPVDRSAGCGMMNAGGSFTIPIVTGATRPYDVVLPKNYDGQKAYPLVFYLHGRGNVIEHKEAELASSDTAIVFYPKSIGTGWEGQADNPAGNLQMIRDIIKIVAAKYCVNMKRIIATGFSSGCWFTSRLGCLMKTELAGMVASGCGLDPAGQCMDKLPAIQIVGDTDPNYSLPGFAPKAADFYRSRNGCAMTQKPGRVMTCMDYDGCANGYPASFCRFPGGHQWSMAVGPKAIIDLLARIDGR
jgi:polyhydroxybutyrate depolymerase